MDLAREHEIDIKQNSARLRRGLPAVLGKRASRHLPGREFQRASDTTAGNSGAACTNNANVNVDIQTTTDSWRWLQRRMDCPGRMAGVQRAQCADDRQLHHPAARRERERRDCLGGLELRHHPARQFRHPGYRRLANLDHGDPHRHAQCRQLQPRSVRANRGMELQLD